MLYTIMLAISSTTKPFWAQASVICFRQKFGHGSLQVQATRPSQKCGVWDFRHFRAQFWLGRQWGHPRPSSGCARAAQGFQGGKHQCGCGQCQCATTDSDQDEPLPDPATPKCGQFAGRGGGCLLEEQERSNPRRSTQRDWDLMESPEVADLPQDESP